MRWAKSMAIEACLVAFVGMALALVANGISPRGLRLSRDYFPAIAPVAVPVSSAPLAPSAAGGESAAPVVDALTARLQQRGLHLVRSNEVIELFRDPRREQGLVLFVDARDDAHFAAGHIPGAWPFDRYRPEAYLPTVLPACLAALKVVVYCNGGECEDSEFAAVMLREAGVAADSLLVYAGGIAEWKTLGLPVETGPRNR